MANRNPGPAAPVKYAKGAPRGVRVAPTEFTHRTTEGKMR